MAITVKCPCGKMLQARDDQAGQSVQCPFCRGVVGVPVGLATAAPEAPPKPGEVRAEAALSLVAFAVVFAVLACGVVAVEPQTAKFIGTALGLGAIAALGSLLSGKPKRPGP